MALVEGRTSVLGSFALQPTFPEIEGWRTQSTLAAMNWTPYFRQRDLPAQRANEAQEPAQTRAFRDSVARGYALFMSRTFLIRDSTSLTVLTGNPTKQTCADCHNMQSTGMDNAPGYLDLGTANYPTATPAPDLPLFKVTCHRDAPPHPYLGRTIYTSDPGRALVTGKCVDVGSITAQQMRALAGRAPYFAGGSAKDLRGIIEFYDRRFKIGYSDQDIQDLVNFMGVL
jgi:cytochrome c peroxidase